MQPQTLIPQCHNFQTNYFEPNESKFGGAAILVKNNIDMISTRDNLKLQNNAHTYRVEDIG